MLSMEKELTEYLTLTQVCEILKLQPNTLRNWDANGVLKATRLGPRKIRHYKKEDLLKFVNKHKPSISKHRNVIRCG